MSRCACARDSARTVRRTMRARNLDHRPAEVEEEQHHTEIHRSDRSGWKEQGSRRYCEQRTAGRDPGPAATEARLRSVAHRADQRIGDRVPRASEHQNETDQRQRKAELCCVERGQIDRERQPRAGDRNSNRRKRGKAPAGQSFGRAAARLSCACVRVRKTTTGTAASGVIVPAFKPLRPPRVCSPQPDDLAAARALPSSA